MKMLPLPSAPVGETLAVLLEALAQAAATHRPILLISRRHTGPHLLAHAVHHASLNAHGRFLALRCGLGPPSTVTATFFGSQRRGYPGREHGVLAAADGGTLFVEQLHLAPPEIQEAVLRIMADRELVIGQFTRRVNIRIIASLPADVDGALGTGRLRRDLYHHLVPGAVFVPPPFLEEEAILGQLGAWRNALVAHDQTGDVPQGPPPPPASSRLPAALRTAGAALGPEAQTEELLSALLKELRPLLPETVAQQQLQAAVATAAALCVAHHRSLGPRLYALFVTEMRRALVRRAVEEARGGLTCAAALLGMTLPELEAQIRELGLTLPSAECCSHVPGP